MLVLAALLATSGLVWLAATRPERQRGAEARRLGQLTRVPAGELTFDQAEDGAVLARKLGVPKEEAKFKAAAQRLKKHRST